MELIVKHAPIDVEEEKLDSEIIELARSFSCSPTTASGASAGPLNQHLIARCREGVRGGASPRDTEDPMHGPGRSLIARSGQRCLWGPPSLLGQATPDGRSSRAGDRLQPRSAGRPDRQGLQQWHGRSLQQGPKEGRVPRLPGRSAI